ncbi:Transferase [Parasponia andersonii]|uniref:Transferase n=1 Tax=Parasponia andersonii TaxID=3476 RepID=A0A2P5DS26_PARAD|nr:Transferase [Parasponia andersonii]
MKIIEVEIVSTSTVKPSSPTPSHLRFHQLSFIDQLCGHTYNPSVLFYPPKPENEKISVVEISKTLKQSLSGVLSWYYPLAGRLKDNSFVDCNDEGIPYVEARVNCNISDIIQNSILHQLHKFVPLDLSGKVDLLLGVQLSIFNCGGIAIGSCISHKIGDGLSALMFTKFWAAMVRVDEDGKSKMLMPHFVSSTVFPPRNMSLLGQGVDIPTKNLVSRRFVIDCSKLEAYREKYAESQKLENPQMRLPSRLEALSALICSRFIAATKGPNAEKRRYAIAHAFNLRPRMDPPLLENSFGNISRTIIQHLDLTSCCGDDSTTYSHIVKQMRDLMSRGKQQEFVKNLQKGIDQTSNFFKEHAEEFANGELVSFNFTSLCRFPLYEDFGWGKPSWVSTNPLPYKNLIVFADNESGDGIQAYIVFEEQDMARFESDKEFRSFLSPPIESN